MENQKDNILKNALILFTITIIAAVILGFVYNITLEPIAAQQLKTRDNALGNVLPDTSFDTLEVQNQETYSQLVELFEGKDAAGNVVGYAFKMATKEGYGDLIELIVGIRMDGTIAGIDVIRQAETPGLGAKVDEPSFKDQFAGKVATALTVVKGAAGAEEEISSISGATITSRAATNAVNQAVEYFNTEIAKEGN
ncbi:RnfABCDGE type electron transport complex subunit G [Anaerotalea alkaliphila]|uniref:Ion-translocating oxidoreductase complex subunit G n=1 Tax=Anaerotalea alkaliphila TaxID=2662126 RepID=A0A7X5HWM4_9FIRM|nr:RnfABCDGE type electron transport complex subunit G [Anaerotalea alkaliphila]NDL67956.1 RnfABCDGE type electron transport complex subunit G [Anaerotalea alkaliphila]